MGLNAIVFSQLLVAMKYIIVFLLNYCCFLLKAQVINLDEADLKGAVESVEVRNYRGNEINEVIQKGDLIHRINYENHDAIFDSSGNVVASMEYDSFSHPWVETKISYDSIGNELLRQIKIYKSYGNDYAIDYDSSYYISHYLLNSNGQITLKQTEKFILFNEYKESANNYFYYWYNKNGHLDSMKELRNNEVYIFKNQTDDEGRITESKFFSGDTINLSPGAVTRYTYTDSGKIDTMEVMDEERNTMTISTFNYNSFNDPLMKTNLYTVINNEQILLFDYEYDEKGNWTKRTMRDSNGPIIITERVIHYFK